MGLSALQVEELVAELVPLAVGAEVRGAHALPPRDLLLALAPRDPRAGAHFRLRISADPEAARVHAQIAPVRRHAGSADPFFTRVEEALAGTVLHALEAVHGDRVVRFAFRRAGAPSAQLVAELTGRHANLVLLDGGGRVQAALVQPSSGTSGAARLAPGAVYELPPGRRAGGERGPAVAESFPAPPDAETDPVAARAPLSARVERALGHVAEERYVADARRELVRRFERRRANAAALVAGLERRAEAAGEAERVRMDADLLLAHLAMVPRGANEVELPDSFTPDSPPRRIALDPGLGARRNAEKLFARYKKLVRALERVPEELAQARAVLASVEGWVARAAEEPPEELEAAAIAAGLLTAPQAPPDRPTKVAPRLPYLRFTGVRGSEIRVGRNARDNDELTFHASNGNDVWLHTADCPGSHVVLRLQRGAEPDDEEVLDAAHLAVHFSPQKDAPRVSVHVARRKEVHKPRKAPPGLVTLSGGKVVRLRIEPERLDRLLRTRRQSPAADE